MTSSLRPIYIGDTLQRLTGADVQGEYVSMLGDTFYKIRNYGAMQPFFMSLVSSSDHWLFISSSGGLSAGRTSAEQAIFPYYTEDKLAENSENTGNKALFLVKREAKTSLWEPFSARQHGVYQIERNIYKNVTGTALIFEETNFSLGVSYRYAWRTSDLFGFVKTSWLENLGQSPVSVELLDGLQNILPANVSTLTQNTFSCLLDAYKRSEIYGGNGLAIFALNSTLTDLAQPSESLLATSVMQIGLENTDYLLSSAQLDNFRAGLGVESESDVRGRRGAFFVHTTLALAPQEVRDWHILADVQQDSAAITQKHHWLQGAPAILVREVEEDIAAGQKNLTKIVAGADGLQVSRNQALGAHHFANVMFNVMRGGIFADQYWIRKNDLVEFVSTRNKPLLKECAAFFTELPEKLMLADLVERASASGIGDLVRLSASYLPLSFSRRHGDPSRPWNRFAINIKKADGSMKIDYEGNWRDIFQNWEALAYSYPEYVESMICTFLNATTVDGYNPYRITHNGLDWEHPEPGNPWANLGYWSDHQIIYLQKLMEISARIHPGKLSEYLSHQLFSYAEVPYRIKPYGDLLKDPYNTIDFDWDLHHKIENRVKEWGTDGKLVFAPDGNILRGSLAEKLLTLLLTKLVNFVPEGGIWMNTQRPEWNDANNALVGKGISVVTLGYMRRMIVFCKVLFQANQTGAVPLAAEVATFYRKIGEICTRFLACLQRSFSAAERREMMDALGKTGSDYRWSFYHNGVSGVIVQAPVQQIVEFLDLVQRFVEHTLRANRRADHLYHAYNILHLEDGKATVSSLYEMLEGQVAILSSGLLDEDESLALLEGLRKSALYQAEQESYVLYPDRHVPGFMQKNRMTMDQVRTIALFTALIEARDKRLVSVDIDGVYHFNGHIRNFQDVQRVMEEIKKDARFAGLVELDYQKIHDLFEETFHHNEFTGRSGTFFAYEGLGSVYWHMVAKLLLAAQETALRFHSGHSAEALRERYIDIRAGLGFNKSAQDFGAFPSDPYSHTPLGRGAQQPGMTGLVKEEILTRQAELGLMIRNGCLAFDFALLDRDEFITAPCEFDYWDVEGNISHLQLQPGCLAYTVCQVPVILQQSPDSEIVVHLSSGEVRTVAGSVLDADMSRHIFQRDGIVKQLVVKVPGAAPR